MCALSFLAVELLACAGARSEVLFTVQFEPGSKWFTESWSSEARAEMEAYFADLGRLFMADAKVVVEVNDNQEGAFASAGATWSTHVAVAGFADSFRATSLWALIVKGVDENGPAADARINWNLDVDAIYGGSSSRMIDNIRGLARHEMHHVFGSSSSLFHSTDSDRRGSGTQPSLIDRLYHDANDMPLLGEPYPGFPGFVTINNYTLAADWASVRNQSGLYFAARDHRGRLVKMPPISRDGYIDFSHITGISYVNDHPSWRNYEDTDLNFLRAMGYPLTADAALSARAPVENIRINEGQVVITVQSLVARHYRLATSTDLRRWIVLPEGWPGTGGSFELTSPFEPDNEPARFFQAVEIQ